MLPVLEALWLLAYSLPRLSDVAGWSLTNHLQTLGGEGVLSALLLVRDVLVTLHLPTISVKSSQTDTPVTAVMGDYSPYAHSLKCQVM